MNLKKSLLSAVLSMFVGLSLILGFGVTSANAAPVSAPRGIGAASITVPEIQSPCGAGPQDLNSAAPAAEAAGVPVSPECSGGIGAQYTCSHSTYATIYNKWFYYSSKMPVPCKGSYAIIRNNTTGKVIAVKNFTPFDLNKWCSENSFTCGVAVSGGFFILGLFFSPSS